MHTALFTTLALFLFFLPLYEAPKNIFCGLFILVGIAMLVTNRRHERSSTYRIWSLVLLSVSTFASGIVEDKNYVDLFFDNLNWAIMPLSGAIIMGSRFSERRILALLRVLNIGTCIAVAQGYIYWYGASYPELNSVGHVNQSSLYLAFACYPAMMIVFLSSSKADKLISLLALVAILIFQTDAKSLVGFAATAFCCLGFWFVHCLKLWGLKRTIVATVVISFGGVLLAWIPADPSHYGPLKALKIEFDKRVNVESDLLSGRGKILNAALEVASDSVFGFGLGEFGTATSVQNLKASVERDGKDWMKLSGEFVSTSHGHNLFANVLVERGWFGVICFTTFLIVWFGIFIKLYNQNKQCSLWGGLLMLSILLTGLGQSSLHVEHGQLAFVLIALMGSLPAGTSITGGGRVTR